MVKKENNWIAWAALAIALVALISVLGNAYMTGNFIRVNNLGALGKIPVYMKAEVDTLLPNTIYLDDREGSQVVTVTLATDSDRSSRFVYSAKKYKIEFISASDSAATIGVTVSPYGISPDGISEVGISEVAEISEGQSGIINGVRVEVISADETNFKSSAILRVSGS